VRVFIDDLVQRFAAPPDSERDWASGASEEPPSAQRSPAATRKPRRRAAPADD
jgi:hypothetical protein